MASPLQLVLCQATFQLLGSSRMCPHPIRCKLTDLMGVRRSWRACWMLPANFSLLRVLTTSA